MDKNEKELALSPYRALDLTDEKGFLCGKILGDLGVDVIKVESPLGEPSRRIGPFYEDIPDPEKSLYWFAYNSNKRGITLNIETQDGKELFKRLVKEADFVIESFPVGFMERLGLGYLTLSEINPRIIMTSISHFGQTGPYKGYKGCDIVDWAMSGYMYVCGDPDRPPVRISCPQAYVNAGAEAAAGTLIALYHRQRTGEGQWVDVSIQQSLVRLPFNVRQLWEFNGEIMHRQGCFQGGIPSYPLRREVWPCKDGNISLELVGGAAGARAFRPLVRWMEEEGMVDELLKNLEWEKFDIAKATPEFLQQIIACFARFFMTHTKTELYQEAKKRRFVLYPVADIKEVVENPHLAAREFWEKVKHPELHATIIYPGAFLKAPETPITTRLRAPLIGEHNEDVYGELGISRAKRLALKQANII